MEINENIKNVEEKYGSMYKMEKLEKSVKMYRPILMENTYKKCKYITENGISGDWKLFTNVYEILEKFRNYIKKEIIGKRGNYIHFREYVGLFEELKKLDKELEELENSLNERNMLENVKEIVKNRK